jgi:hypothetical protein
VAGYRIPAANQGSTAEQIIVGFGNAEIIYIVGCYELGADSFVVF